MVSMYLWRASVKVRMLLLDVDDTLGLLLIFDGLLWGSPMDGCCFVLAVRFCLGIKKEVRNSKKGASVKGRTRLLDADILRSVAELFGGLRGFIK